jgi:hypothetical protein
MPSGGSKHGSSTKLPAKQRCAGEATGASPAPLHCPPWRTSTRRPWRKLPSGANGVYVVILLDTRALETGNGNATHARTTTIAPSSRGREATVRRRCGCS